MVKSYRINKLHDSIILQDNTKNNRKRFNIQQDNKLF
jgi:hypothetical protein